MREYVLCIKSVNIWWTTLSPYVVGQLTLKVKRVPSSPPHSGFYFLAWSLERVLQIVPWSLEWDCQGAKVHHVSPHTPHTCHATPTCFTTAMMNYIKNVLKVLQNLDSQRTKKKAIKYFSKCFKIKASDVQLVRVQCVPYVTGGSLAHCPGFTFFDSSTPGPVHGGWL